MAVVTLGACTIQTTDDSASTTTIAPATTITPEGPVTIPPDRSGAISVDNLDEAGVKLTEVAEVDGPVAMAPRSGSESIYVLERRGAVREITRTFKINSRTGVRTLDRLQAERTPLIDFSADVKTGGSDTQGAIDLAFSSDGRFLFVSYTNEDDSLVVDRYTVDDTDVDRRSREQALLIEQLSPDNNGGALAIGPDGFLYIGLGDTGGQSDPLDAGQDLAKSPASVLRVDVSAGGDQPYQVPPGNPYFDQVEVVPEIWLNGVRDPRFLSFDRDTGSMWLVDNGQDREEINFLAEYEGGGRAANLGWDQVEGSESGGPEDATPPLHSYGHDGGCKAIGGYVYRGRAIPGLRGAYVFGDLCTGQIRALLEREGEVIRERVLDIGVPPESLTGFGEDPDGEMYVLTAGGGVLRIDPV
jgi:glucose/arabinose dehydrogenase